MRGVGIRMVLNTLDAVDGMKQEDYSKDNRDRCILERENCDFERG